MVPRFLDSFNQIPPPNGKERLTMSHSLSPNIPIYQKNVKGTALVPGDIIISNQAYGTILEITQDTIITTTGNRRFYPNHSYPIFQIQEDKDNEHSQV